MKRIIAIVLLLALCVSLCACGAKSKETEKKIPEAAPTAAVEREAPAEEEETTPVEYYYGTWTPGKVRSGDKFYSVEDFIKAGGSAEVTEIVMVLQESGLMYFAGAVNSWSAAENGIEVNGKRFELYDGGLLLVIDDKNNALLFEKVSDSQEIPEGKPEEEPEETKAEGIRPEFKATMDSYEEFFNEYCELLEKYMKNPSDMSILMKYADMMTKAAEMEEKLNDWDQSEMSSEELQYYIEVTARIEKKMAGLY